MEQGFHGAQNEPFFDLLHPTAAPRPSPYPSLQHNGYDDAHHFPPSETPSLEPIAPSYDFQLTRFPKAVEAKQKAEDLSPPLYKGSSPPSNANNTHDHLGGYYNEQTSRFKEDKDAFDQAIVSTIEATMKNHTEKLLNALEGVKGRLFQLENTVQGLERSLQKLQLAEGEKQTGSDEKFLKLEHLIEEVNTKLQILQDNQKALDQNKPYLQPQIMNDKVPTVQAPVPESWQQSKEEVHPQYTPQLPTQYPHPPPQQSFVSQNIPSSSISESKSSAQPFPPASQPSPPPPVTQSTGQPLPAQSVAPTFHYQQSTQPALPSQGSYNPSLDASPYGHLQPHPLPPTMALPGSYQPETAQYPAGAYGGPRQHPVPQEVVPSSQHHVPSVSQQVYESHGRVGAGVMASPYLQAVPQSSPPAAVYETSGGGSYGVPPYRASQPVPSAPSGGASGYPRLPTAQPVHPALPAAVLSSSASRSPVDEVIEKVVSMGFPREQVRSVVRDFTENGQSVELNVVLDRLMNGAKPQRGWFG